MVARTHLDTILYVYYLSCYSGFLTFVGLQYKKHTVLHSLLRFRNLSDWAGYKSSSAFRGHNTWAYRRFMWRCWRHAEREDTQVRVRILVSSNVMRVIKRVLQKRTSLLAVIVLFLLINNSSSVTRPVSCCSFDSRLI